jgi:hypothetical protein
MGLYWGWSLGAKGLRFIKADGADGCVGVEAFIFLMVGGAEVEFWDGEAGLLEFLEGGVCFVQINGGCPGCPPYSSGSDGGGAAWV